MERLKDGQKVRALVADDVAENRAVLASILEGVGVEVAVVTNGREAVAAIKADGFDVREVEEVREVKEEEEAEVGEVKLPEELLGRLRQAAVEGNVTALEQEIEEVQGLGDRDAQMEKGLKALSDEFRMEDVAEELKSSQPS